MEQATPDINDAYVTLVQFQRLLAARGVQRSYQSLLNDARAGRIPVLTVETAYAHARRPLYLVRRAEAERYAPPRDRRRAVAVDGERYPSVSAAARALGVSRPTVYAMIARGDAIYL